MSLTSTAVFPFLILLLILSGCSRVMPTPRKEIEVTDGGPPVLTTEERAAQKASAKTSTSVPRYMVAQASYEQPVEEPRLLKPLDQWTEQEAAADALGRIGAAAVPELINALDSPDPSIRVKAVNVLGRMGPASAPAVPSLVRLLQDPDISIRKAAARTLGQIGPAAKDAVPALMQTLLEPSPAATAP